MQVVAVLFPGVTALDIVGPYEVLQRLPDTTVVFVGHEVGSVRTDNGYLGLNVDRTFNEITQPDIVIVPGGPGTDALLENRSFLDWLKEVHTTTRFTTSVCTGALALGAAGLLKGLTATTHWGRMEELKRFGAIPTTQRVVEHLERRIITAAGVSAGIDMALCLTELLIDDVAAKAMQLMIEYDPQPPYDCGRLSTAPPEVVGRLVEYAAAR